MESVKKFLFVVCITVAFATAIADPPTWPASDLSGKCLDEWEGVFFPGIPNIKSLTIWEEKTMFSGAVVKGNHATLSGHSCHHELETARLNGLLGNIDANTCDPQIGWDTDQFLTDIQEVTMVMLSVVRNGGLAPGGFNFDAKLRRESTDIEDLFIAHITGMDTLARGLLKCRQAYRGRFNSELGAQIEVGKMDFETLEKKAMERVDFFFRVRLFFRKRVSVI